MMACAWYLVKQVNKLLKKLRKISDLKVSFFLKLDAVECRISRIKSLGMFPMRVYPVHPSFNGNMRRQFLRLLTGICVFYGVSVSMAFAQNGDVGFRGEGFLEGMVFTPVGTTRTIAATDVSETRSGLRNAEDEKDSVAFQSRINQQGRRTGLGIGTTKDGVIGAAQDRRNLAKSEEKRLSAKRDNRTAEATLRKATRRADGRGTRNWYRK